MQNLSRNLYSYSKSIPLISLKVTIDLYDDFDGPRKTYKL